MSLFRPQPIQDSVLYGIEKDGIWGYEHPDFYHEDWSHEVQEGSTILGYFEWVSARIEQTRDEEEKEKSVVCHQCQVKDVTMHIRGTKVVKLLGQLRDCEHKLALKNVVLVNEQAAHNRLRIRAARQYSDILHRNNYLSSRVRSLINDNETLHDIIQDKKS